MFARTANHFGATIAAQIEPILRENILYSREGYRPGERIYVDRLIAELGVSATPIKEALKRLTAEGLVVTIPRRGFYVADISEEDLLEILNVGEGLERMAIRLANGRVPDAILHEMETAVGQAAREVAAGDFEAYVLADLQFHRLIVKMAGNRLLQSIYEQAMTRSQIRYVFHPRLGEASLISIEQHRELIRVLAQGDASASDRALAQHWTGSRERMIASHRAFEGKVRERGEP